MGRKGSARGPFAGRCFLVGPFRSAARADAPLHREAFSSSLVRMDIGLPALQLRFLAAPCLAGACAAALAATSCLPGACVAALAAGWRALAKPSNILAAPAGKAALLLLALREKGWPRRRASRLAGSCQAAARLHPFLRASAAAPAASRGSTRPTYLAPKHRSKAARLAFLS